ncbi:class I SAM-dependent methyltransferase [Phytoactinopolyspora halotolerans]|uniref:Class I SAM-dependent methyltransferase n=1 Tax=Phytoactinopolyspora halotolerans TaxID=1981512 RepID=A0A6L9SA67_9ACTN|nr:class I SAM-dependent methyltransferase [Phytoactinopolyspora halotolerans]NEE01999.1 class I SAM-dependent methyltransferase [Phytoactinopolyspora halotolerans]
MPVLDRPRYDGHAEWYDEWSSEAASQHGRIVSALLGPGTGRCLDLGCGTGRYLDVLRSTGRTVVGIDISADQLRVARRRTRALIRGDAARLPFADGTFETVVATWVSTDVDDFRGTVGEVARVLVPGGLFLFYGVHPCFNGPFVEWADDERRIIHPTYRRAGWHERAPWWNGGGIRDRVGMRHVPLADLVNAIIAARLSIARVAEPDRDAWGMSHPGPAQPSPGKTAPRFRVCLPCSPIDPRSRVEAPELRWRLWRSSRMF